MRRSRAHAARAALTLLVAHVAVAPAAHAQQEPDSSALELDPVVVRVLRSSVGTGVSVPVTVVGGPELTRATRGAFLEETLRAIPGVQIQNRFNFSVGERLAVRGFGARAQFGVRGVRVLVDGIPATLPDGQTTLDHLDLEALGRVEVLRGPGAAQYGNAAGGVLHFRTRIPSQGAGLTARIVTGSDGLLNLEGAVEGAVGDVGFRLGGNRLTYDGYRRNPVADDGSTYGGARRSVVNAVMRAPLGRGTVRAVLNGVDLNAQNPGSLSQDLLDEGRRSAYRFNVINGTRKEVRQGQAGITWSGPVGALRGEMATWGVRRTVFSPIPSKVIDLARWAGGLRALFTGTAGTALGRLTLGGGVELETQRDDRKNFDNDGGRPGALELDQLERVAGSGAFVQARLDVGRRWSTSASVRFDRFRFRADDAFTAGGDPDDSGERTMSALSPSVGMVLTPVADIELFGNVGRSFETPTTTELVNRPSGAGGFNPDLGPQTGWTSEAGVRLRAGGDWALEAVVFRTRLENELVPFEVPDEPGRSFFRNSGSSLHRGVEVAVDGRPTPRVTLRAAYTHIDARFQDFAIGDVDYAGNRVPGLAPTRVDGTVTWQDPRGFVEVRGLYQSDVPVDDANRYESGSWFVADVRAGWTDWRMRGLRATPFLGISNVFDTRYNSSVAVNAFGRRFFEPGPGRTYHVGLSVALGRG